MNRNFLYLCHASFSRTVHCDWRSSNRRLRKRWWTRGALTFMYFWPWSFVALTFVFDKIWNSDSQVTLRGNSGRKKVKLKWKSVKNAKKKQRAITDLNAPNGSRDTPFQSQEFGQDGHRHFVGFQPHFHLNMTSETQCCKTMKKWKCNISDIFCLICLKFCRVLALGKGISLHFKFRCYGNQNQLFKQKWCSKSNLKEYSLIATAGSIKFWKKMGDTLLLWENNSLLFLNKGWLFSSELP